MKNLLKTNVLVNYGVRHLLAACAGSFVGSTMKLAIKSEQKMIDKITVAAGALVTSYIVGNALDEPFNKMLEEGEKEEFNKEVKLLMDKEFGTEEEASEI